LPCLFLSHGFCARGFQSRGLGPFQFPPRGVLSCLFLSLCLPTQALLPGKFLTSSFQSRRLAPGRLLGAGAVLPQLLLPRRFKLRLPCLFLSHGFCACAFQSCGLGPFQFPSSGVLSCLFLSLCLSTQALLPGKFLASGFQSRRLAPGRLLGAGGVLP
jgi:hypothetical protein